MDIFIWNETQEVRGAHVGVFIGECKAVHLAKKEGFAVTWELDEFPKREEYQVYIAAKRVLKQGEWLVLLGIHRTIKKRSFLKMYIFIFTFIGFVWYVFVLFVFCYG